VDSRDFVEAVMVLEEVLEVEIPADDAEKCGGPREMVFAAKRGNYSNAGHMTRFYEQ
jgi:hypothetical protein